jgi:PleD family two-component response regulator
MNGGTAKERVNTGYHSSMVLAVLDDLLFSSKIRAVASHTGQPVAFSRTRASVVADIVAHQADLVILDLDRDALEPLGVIADIRANEVTRGTRIVGFVSHVHAERIEQAKEAGVDRVMARSAFVKALPRLLAGEPDVPDAPETPEPE